MPGRNVKKEGNRRGKKRLYIDFTEEEKRAIRTNIVIHGDRVREARLQNTTTTVINLIFGGQR